MGRRNARSKFFVRAFRRPRDAHIPPRHPRACPGDLDGNEHHVRVSPARAAILDRTCRSSRDEWTSGGASPPLAGRLDTPCLPPAQPRCTGARAVVPGGRRWSGSPSAGSRNPPAGAASPSAPLTPRESAPRRRGHQRYTAYIPNMSSDGSHGRASSLPWAGPKSGPAGAPQVELSLAFTHIHLRVGLGRKWRKMDKSLKDILSSIDELAKRGNVTRNRAFAAWYAINFHNLDEDDALESAAADGGNDQGIDIAFWDDSSQEVIILQAHCPESFNKVTPKSKWDALTSSIPFIRNPAQLSKSGRPDLAENISGIKSAHPDHSVAVGLITLGLKSDSIDRSVRAHSSDQAVSDINYFHLAQQDIVGNYRALVEAEAGVPEDDLNFSGSFIEDKGDYGRAWVGSVTASELQRLHRAHGDKLFAGNVRLFLGARKRGNKRADNQDCKRNPRNVLGPQQRHHDRCGHCL